MAPGGADAHEYGAQSLIFLFSLSSHEFTNPVLSSNPGGRHGGLGEGGFQKPHPQGGEIQQQSGPCTTKGYF